MFHRPQMELFAKGHVLCSTFPTKFTSRTNPMKRPAKSAAAAEIAAIEDLMGDLEKRLRRLSGSAKREASGATGEVGEFVSEALDRIMTRVHETASEATHSVAEEASRF